MLRLFLTITCISSLIFLFLITNAVAAIKENRYTYKQMAVINDAPGEGDLIKYLGALEKGIYFVTMHKYYVDITLSFGIFLADVNIRTIVKYKLSDPVRSRFKHLLESTGDILEYFYRTVLNHKKEHREALRPLLSLYMNNTAWVSNMQGLNYNLLKKTNFYSRKELVNRYAKWSKYKKDIYINITDPDPMSEDDCFNLLAQNPVYDVKKKVVCHVPYSCISFALNGSDFGYTMKNRLLLLTASLFSRSCTFGLVADHKNIMSDLCAQMYNEDEYIVYHDFREPRLFLEHIALCSLLGHAQFLRESWVDELMDFQTAVGCFTTVRPTENNAYSDIRSIEMRDWEFLKSKPTIWAGSCFRHVTGAGIAVLASALRYIIETYRSLN